MNSQIRENKIGKGFVPLFVAAMLFWTGVVGLAVWLAK